MSPEPMKVTQLALSGSMFEPPMMPPPGCSAPLLAHWLESDPEVSDNEDADDGTDNDDIDDIDWTPQTPPQPVKGNKKLLLLSTEVLKCPEVTGLVWAVPCYAVSTQVEAGSRRSLMPPPKEAAPSFLPQGQSPPVPSAAASGPLRLPPGLEVCRRDAGSRSMPAGSSGAILSTSPPLLSARPAAPPGLAERLEPWSRQSTQDDQTPATLSLSEALPGPVNSFETSSWYPSLLAANCLVMKPQEFPSPLTVLSSKAFPGPGPCDPRRLDFSELPNLLGSRSGGVKGIKNQKLSLARLTL